MKVKFTENGGCYCASLEAETVAEAAALVRMGMDSTRELRSCSTEAYQDGTVSSYIVVGKSKKADSHVPKRGAR